MGGEVSAIEDIIMVNRFYTNKQHFILNLFPKCNVPTVTTSRESRSNAQKKNYSVKTSSFYQVSFSFLLDHMSIVLCCPFPAL